MSDYGDVGPYLRTFRTTLSIQPDDELVVRERILHGATYAIDEEQHFDLKRRIAGELGTDMNTEVFVVGSAKLGFSIAPRKRYVKFNDHSDIDVAIVSHALYQRVWHEAHEYSLSGADWTNRERFERYLAWGWIRPDQLPRSESFTFSNAWFEFFRDLQRRRVAGPFKVAAAIYHDMSFLIQYQRSSVALCREGAR